MMDSNAEMRSARRPRSPAYPFIDLAKALVLVEALARGQGRSAFSASEAATTWKMRADSSALAQRVGALKQFGLLHDVGRDHRQRFTVSGLAHEILGADIKLDRQSLRVAALRPRIFSRLWEELNRDPSVDRAKLMQLLREQSPPFNAKAAEDVLRVFRETMAFAQMVRTVGQPPALENDDLSEVTEWRDVLNTESNTIRVSYRSKPGRQDYEMLRDYFELKVKHARKQQVSSPTRPK